MSVKAQLHIVLGCLLGCNAIRKQCNCTFADSGAISNAIAQGRVIWIVTRNINSALAPLFFLVPSFFPCT